MNNLRNSETQQYKFILQFKNVRINLKILKFKKFKNFEGFKNDLNLFQLNTNAVRTLIHFFISLLSSKKYTIHLLVFFFVGVRLF